MSKDDNFVKKSTKAVADLNLSLKERVRIVVEEGGTKAGVIFDYGIQFLIITSIIIYSVGTLPNLSVKTRSILHILDIGFYMIFTLEYLARIYISKKPFKYIFSFYGIVDLLAILPFVAGGKFDLRALRALRIFRIIRALKISKYNKALNRFSVTLKILKPELIMFFIVTSIFIFLAAAGIFYFEHPAQPEKFASIFHSLWWAVITLTTVGYGDVYPITVGGRAFTFFILILGLGIVTIPSGLIASAVTRARDLEEKENTSSEKEKE